MVIERCADMHDDQNDQHPGADAVRLPRCIEVEVRQGALASDNDLAGSDRTILATPLATIARMST